MDRKYSKLQWETRLQNRRPAGPRAKLEGATCRRTLWLCGTVSDERLVWDKPQRPRVNRRGTGPVGCGISHRGGGRFTLETLTAATSTGRERARMRGIAAAE